MNHVTYLEELIQKATALVSFLETVHKLAEAEGDFDFQIACMKHADNALGFIEFDSNDPVDFVMDATDALIEVINFVISNQGKIKSFLEKLS